MAEYVATDARKQSRDPLIGFLCWVKDRRYLREDELVLMDYHAGRNARAFHEIGTLCVSGSEVEIGLNRGDPVGNDLTFTPPEDERDFRLGQKAVEFGASPEPTMRRITAGIGVEPRVPLNESVNVSDGRRFTCVQFADGLLLEFKAGRWLRWNGWQIHAVKGADKVAIDRNESESFQSTLKLDSLFLPGLDRGESNPREPSAEPFSDFSSAPSVPVLV